MKILPLESSYGQYVSIGDVISDLNVMIQEAPLPNEYRMQLANIVFGLKEIGKELSDWKNADMNKTYTINCSWEMYGHVDVEADSLKEAITKVENETKLSDINSEYVSESFKIAGFHRKEDES